MTVSTMVEHIENTIKTGKICWAKTKLFVLEMNEENKKFVFIYFMVLALFVYFCCLQNK